MGCQEKLLCAGHKLLDKTAAFLTLSSILQVFTCFLKGLTHAETYRLFAENYGFYMQKNILQNFIDNLHKNHGGIQLSDQ